jgi:two-component system, NarL family, response regulator YdfI
VIRVLVVASSPAVRMGLAAMLTNQAGFTVLETTALPAQLGDALDTVEADVMLLALEPGESPALPQFDSPDAAARLPAVLILGDEPVSAWAGRALRNGAQGALPRTAATEQIIAAVTAVAQGLVVRAPSEESAAQSVGLAQVRAVQPLTAREVQIVGLLAEGLPNKAIASRLGISEHTVKSHMTSLFAKLDVSTRAEAVVMAARQGLIML